MGSRRVRRDRATNTFTFQKSKANICTIKSTTFPPMDSFSYDGQRKMTSMMTQNGVKQIFFENVLFVPLDLYGNFFASDTIYDQY